MPALDAAFTLKQVHPVAVAVAKDLDFNVPWLLHEPLNENRTVAKRPFCLGDGTLQFRFQKGGVVHGAHAFASTSRTCLDQQWKPNAFCLLLGLGRI